jgi:acetyl esterase/lipase
MAHSILTYIRLKLSVSFLRTILTWGGYPINPNEKFTIKSTDGKRDIKIHVYKPETSSNPAPIIINWHGSGYVLPMHGSDDYFASFITKYTSYTVLDASYALAPEYPFPAAYDDVTELINHVLSKPDQYDSSNVVLSGFSAGANLALAAALNGNWKPDTFEGLIAFYPPCDLSIPPEDKIAPDGSVGLPANVANLFNASYMPPGVSNKDPRISLRYGDLSKAPKHVLIITAGSDNLAAEGEAIAEGLRMAGKDVTATRVEGVEHAWDKAVKAGSEGEKKRDEAYDLVLKFLNK